MQNCLMTLVKSAVSMYGSATGQVKHGLACMLEAARKWSLVRLVSPDCHPLQMKANAQGT